MRTKERDPLCNFIQVRISALQQANGALMAEAAKAHACPEEPSGLGRSIRSAIELLQDSPVLRERSKNSSNIRRPSSAPGVLDLPRVHLSAQPKPGQPCSTSTASPAAATVWPRLFHLPAWLQDGCFPTQLQLSRSPVNFVTSRNHTLACQLSYASCSGHTMAGAPLTPSGMQVNPKQQECQRRAGHQRSRPRPSAPRPQSLS